MPDRPTPPDRKMQGLRLSDGLMRAVRHLAVDQGQRINDLVEEALRDLLEKYGAKGKRGR